MRISVLILLAALIPIPAFAQKKEKSRFVLVITETGSFKIRLYNETPLHRDNFLSLVKKKYYDELLFHFVKPGSIIEGGDPDSYNATDSTAMLGDGSPGYTLGAEIVEGLYLKRGALVASRKNDKVNPDRESNGSQFFIVQGRRFSLQELNIIERQKKDTISDEQRGIYSTIGGLPALDGQYTVFGEVVEGMEIVDQLIAMPAQSNGRPRTDIKMWMRIVKR